MCKGPRKPIERIDHLGNVVEYESVTHAADSNNVPRKSITDYYVKKPTKYYHGFQWRYKNQDEPGTIWTDHPTLPIKCSKDGRIQFRSGRITFGFKQQGKKDDPNDVYLVIKTMGKHHRVHRLVAETFLANTDEKPTVDHIDRNPFNNHISNLRWATYSEQCFNRAPYKRKCNRK